MHELHTWDPSETEVTRQILALLNKRLAGTMSHATFLWKHDANPIGRSTVLYARDNPGTVVAVRCFMKWQLKYKGRTVDAAQPCDTATAVDASRQGLFTKLTMEGLWQLRETGVEAIFNFPQRGAMTGATKLGWHNMGGLAMYVAPLRLGHTALKAVVSLRRRSAGRRYLPKTVAPDLESLPTSPRLGPPDGHTVGGVRTQESALWRIGQAPHRRYAVIERAGFHYIFVIAQVGRLREATLMDVWADEHDWKAISSELNSAAHETGCEILRVMLSSDHPLKRLLSRTQFFPFKSRSNFVVYDYGTRNFTHSPWMITPYDIDTF